MLCREGLWRVWSTQFRSVDLTRFEPAKKLGKCWCRLKATARLQSRAQRSQIQECRLLAGLFRLALASVDKSNLSDVSETCRKSFFAWWALHLGQDRGQGDCPTDWERWRLRHISVASSGFPHELTNLLAVEDMHRNGRDFPISARGNISDFVQASQI